MIASPSAKCRCTRRPATHNVPLARDVTDDDYLAMLDTWLEHIRASEPELILYQAGVDALAQDKLGSLALSRRCLNERNNKVYTLALQGGLPLVITMGGGYSSPSIDVSVAAHADVYRTASLRLSAYLSAARP